METAKGAAEYSPTCAVCLGSACEERTSDTSVACSARTTSARQMAIATIPDRFRYNDRAILQNYPALAMSQLRKGSLLHSIIGPASSGKTSLACAVMVEVIVLRLTDSRDAKWRFRYVSAPYAALIEPL